MAGLANIANIVKLIATVEMLTATVKDNPVFNWTSLYSSELEKFNVVDILETCVNGLI